MTQPMYERLVREGDAGVWAALEAYYAERVAVPTEALS